MRGYMVPPGHPDDDDASWESTAINAIGNIIDFWGFKHNHGRVWALLFLRAQPLSAGDIQDALSLSKGAVSMISRELEQWGVIHRVRVPNQSAWHFVPETRLQRMIRRVLKEREAQVVTRVKLDLERAQSRAHKDDVAPGALQRIERLTRLASLVDNALTQFTESPDLDMNTALALFSLATIDLSGEPQPED